MLSWQASLTTSRGHFYHAPNCPWTTDKREAKRFRRMKKTTPRLAAVLFSYLAFYSVARAECLPIRIYTSAHGLGSSFIENVMRDFARVSMNLYARRFESLPPNVLVLELSRWYAGPGKM